MMARLIVPMIAAAVLAAGPAAATKHPMKPFFLAWKGSESTEMAVTKARKKLTDGGFKIVGSYSPYPSTTIIGVTNPALGKAAAGSKFGGYGAVQRIAVTRVGKETQVSYTNPRYMAAAYRMKGDLDATAKALEAAMGRVQDFGLKEGMPDAEVREYHYMFGMPYFDEPDKLAEHKSQAEAVAILEKNLAKGIKGVTKIYRVDIPGKEETVFGVAMKGSGEKGKNQDDTFLMSEVDFKPLRSSAHLPYEIVVSGGTAWALSARFRIAINFPDLSMMGDHSFMNIMDAPDAILEALTLAAGGKPEAWED